MSSRQNLRKPRIVTLRLARRPTLYSQIGDTFAIPHEMMSLLSQRQCVTDCDLAAALRGLRSYVKISGKERLLPYIETEDDLRSIRQNHSDYVRPLVPMETELKRLSSVESNAIVASMGNFLGILCLLISVTIENPFDQDLLIT